MKNHIFNRWLPYTIKNGDFIPYDIFIKDLMKRQFFQFNEAATYLGKAKTTIFIVDLGTSEILKKKEKKISHSKKDI